MIMKQKEKLDIAAPRVRIAPSPTGRLHIGTARAALFNWLFARKYGGVFVLRIEDTDLERSDPAFEDDLIKNLKWLGIEWDEGPDIGGQYGPYKQSERMSSYEAKIGQLLEEKKAYYCFCSEEDLESERQAMLASGLAPKYSGRCLLLSPGEAAENLAEGKPSIIRLKMPARMVVISDLVRGDVTFDTKLLGDIVIAKSPTKPLYNFAVVVDDDAMHITHVLRGEDHLSNTPKQWMIAEALGFSHPVYGHFPLILGPDRSKLSKRHGATSIGEYREAGYLPDALINFMVLLGWHPEGDQEIFTREDLIKRFSVERIQKASAVFNIARLDWLNGYYIRRQSDDNLLDMLLPFWLNADYVRAKSSETWEITETGEEINRTFLKNIILLERERIKKLSDIVFATEYFFRAPSYEPGVLLWKDASSAETGNNIEKIIMAVEKLDDREFTRERIAVELKQLYGADRGKILWPLRSALSGRSASPGPMEIAEILGKQKTIERLKYARSLLI